MLGFLEVYWMTVLWAESRFSPSITSLEPLEDKWKKIFTL